MAEALKSMPLEMAEWVLKLVVMLNTPGVSPKSVAFSVGCLGPENPQNCTCGQSDIERYETDRWMHENHALWNDILWTVVNAQPGLVYRLRQVVRRDSSLAIKESKARIWPAGYHNDLLEGFFTPRPTWNKFRSMAA